MTERNGQKVIYSNVYNKYAVTVDKNCKICGNHINIWWIEKDPVLDASYCHFDIAELIPSILSHLMNEGEISGDYVDYVRDCIS